MYARNRINMRVGRKPKVVVEKKTKPCFVRLEKVRGSGLYSRGGASAKNVVVKTKPGSTVNNEDKMNKKLTGPLKKRPIISTPVISPTNNTISPNDSENEESNPTIAAGRSRRAPKPNPKYSNNDIVTPKNKSQININDREGAHRFRKNGQHLADSTDSDDLYNKGGSTSEEEVEDDKDEVFKIEDTESDFEEPPVPPPKRGRGRPRRTEATLPIVSRKIVPQPALPTRNQFRQSFPLQTKKAAPTSVSAATPTTTISKMTKIRADTNVSIIMPTEGAARKRKLNQTDFEKERETIFARNKRLNVEPYDSNKNKPIVAVPHRTSFSPGQKAQTQNNIRRIISTHESKANTGIVIQQKKSLPSSFSNSLTQIGRKSLSSTPHGKSLSISEKQTNAKLIVRQQMASPKIATKSTPLSAAKTSTFKPTLAVSTPTMQKRSSPLAGPISNKNPVDKASPSSTKDDFETMPTFTIVNINDIISKKGDVLINKSPCASDNMSKSNENRDKSPILKSPPSPPSPISNVNKQNRRKAGHTTLLNEKIDPSRLKNPLPRKSLPPSQKKPIQTILNHTLSSKNLNNVNTRTSSTAKSKFAEKPAPRILNSVVAKKTLPVQPMISKCPDTDDPDSPDDSFSLLDDDDDDDDDDDNDISNNDLLTRSPLPTKKTTIANNNNNIIQATKESSNKKPPTLTKSLQRKLPPEKVVVSRQGNKLIKKITCFETWYVINIPEEAPAEVVRNSLEMPLIKLGNAVDSINLPSSEWSSKVNLYQVSPQMLAKSAFITFTGDLTEQSIPEKDRTKYQPSSVMFRRTVQDRSKTRLPYDRAVIFKNKTFFTNIEGKNVKLLGAPTNISSLEEIEVLLELVDELTLRSPFVEQSTTI